MRSHCLFDIDEPSGRLLMSIITFDLAGPVGRMISRGLHSPMATGDLMTQAIIETRLSRSESVVVRVGN